LGPSGPRSGALDSRHDGSQSKNGFVPKINEKNEKKNGEIGRNGFSGKNGKKRKKWVNGRPAVGGMAEERPAVGRGVVGR
jgi:hypothetical protein